MNTHVIHYKKLTERKRYLEPLLQNAIWHDKIDRDTITKDEIDRYYVADINEWYVRSKDMYKEDPTYRELKTGDVCCSISHVVAWDYFYKNDTTDYGLFLEDDVILCDNFYTHLNEVLKAINGFDAIFIGGGFPHTIAPTVNIKKISGYDIITKTHPATNCLCSYVINKCLAEKMSNYLSKNKFVLPIDFEVNYMFKLFDAKIAHVMPMLCVEGSSSGYYSSAQSR